MRKECIFISHAHKDAEYARILAELISKIAKNENIFCTSVDKFRVPNGENFDDYIKNKIQQPKLVIILISENYHRSVFCSMELGATWINAREQFVFILPGSSFLTLQAILKTTQSDNINRAGLCQLHNKLRLLGVEVELYDEWEEARKKCLKDINNLNSFSLYEGIYYETKTPLSTNRGNVSTKDCLVTLFKDSNDQQNLYRIEGATFNTDHTELHTWTSKAFHISEENNGANFHAFYTSKKKWKDEYIDCDGVNVITLHKKEKDVYTQGTGVFIDERVGKVKIELYLIDRNFGLFANANLDWTTLTVCKGKQYIDCRGVFPKLIKNIRDHLCDQGGIA